MTAARCVLAFFLALAGAGMARAADAASWRAEGGVAESDGDSCRLRFNRDEATAWRATEALFAEGILPSRIALSWRLDENAAEIWTFMLVLKDKDGQWFQTASAPVPRAPDAVTTVDVTPLHPGVMARGHAAVWNDYARARVAEVGVRCFSPGGGEARFRLAAAETPADSNESEFRFLHLRGASGFALEEKDYAPLDAWRATAWEPFEFAFDCRPGGDRPCDPDVFAVDVEWKIPSGRLEVRPAFYDQPHRRWLDAAGAERVEPWGRACWKARYTPREAGVHRWRLKARRNGRDLAPAAWRELDVAPGAPRGFVRVAHDDPRYFEEADGRFFWPLGLNLHSPMDARYARLTRREPSTHRGTFLYDERFARMRDAGMNAAIVWMANWWLSLEWRADWPGFGGLADYHLANAWKLDRLFSAAEANGIHLLLVLDNHGKLSAGIDPEWSDNPYNAALGGPCEDPEDFWANDAAWEQYRKRLRYIVARWGAHPNLWGFELVSEINWTGSTRAMVNLPEHAAWLKRVKTELRRLDVYERPVTLQYSGLPKHVDADVAGSEALSFLAVNGYRASATLPDFLAGVHTAHARLAKPVLVAEFGGDWNGATPARLHADLHAGLWTALALDAPAAPFFWWHEYVDERGLYGEFAAVARARERLDAANRRRRVPARTDNKALRCLASAHEGGFAAWLFDAATVDLMPETAWLPEHSSASLILAELPDGAYSYQWHRVRDGEEIARGRVEVRGGETRLAAPGFAGGLWLTGRREAP